LHAHATPRFRHAFVVLVGFAILATSGGAIAQMAPRDEACEDVPRFEALPFAAPTSPCQTKPWNVLFYSAADFGGGEGFDPWFAFADHVGSGPHVNVLILDDAYSPTEDDYVYWVEHQTCSRCLKPILNLGEPATDEAGALEAFLRFAAKWFPAERTLLFLYGHGGAWLGACTDESNGTTMCGETRCDWLTPVEMRLALEAVGGVDALMFSAPCVMASLEVAYELREVTDIYVASEEGSGYLYWSNAVGPIVASLEEDPRQDIDDVARNTIDIIRSTMEEVLEDGYWAYLVTYLPNISAIRSSALSTVAAAVDALAGAALALSPEDRGALTDARLRCPSFSPELIDLLALAKSCEQIAGISTEASAVVAAVDQAIIGQVASNISPYGESHGLSIFYPHPAGFAWAADPEGSENIYVNYGLSFTADTDWDEFVSSLLGEQSTP